MPRTASELSLPAPIWCADQHTPACCCWSQQFCCHQASAHAFVAPQNCPPPQKRLWPDLPPRHQDNPTTVVGHDPDLALPSSSPAHQQYPAEPARVRVCDVRALAQPHSAETQLSPTLDNLCRTAHNTTYTATPHASMLHTPAQDAAEGFSWRPQAVLEQHS